MSNKRRREANRKGIIKQEWAAYCRQGICGWIVSRPTYQEASIALTNHLEDPRYARFHNSRKEAGIRAVAVSQSEIGNHKSKILS